MLDVLRRLTLRRKTRNSSSNNSNGSRSVRPTKTLHVQVHSESFYTGPDGLVTIWDAKRRRMVTRKAGVADAEGAGVVYFVWDEEPVARGAEHGWGHPPFGLGARVVVRTSEREERVGEGEGEVEVVRKLGWGDSASVWLALLHRKPGESDIDVLSSETETETEKPASEPSPARFYAYKVLTVASSALLVQNRMHEKQVLLAVDSLYGAPGSEFCDRAHMMLSTRTVQGHHEGFLFDVHGSDLGKLVELQPGQKLSSKVTRCVLGQLLQGLQFLHDTCKIIHADIKENNIAVRIPQNRQMIADYIQREPSTTYPPRVAPKIISPDPVATVCSQPVPNFGLDDDLGNISIVLGDFGSAVFVEEGLMGVVQPARYRAPEVNLGHPWSTPIDIWSIGCLVFEWLTATDAFPLTFEGLESIADEERYLQLVCALQTKTTGAFTAAFIARCTRADVYFHENGVPRFKPAVTKTTILERIRLAGYAEADDWLAANFIERCLTMDPALRPSAADLLQDEWLATI